MLTMITLSLFDKIKKADTISITGMLLFAFAVLLAMFTDIALIQFLLSF